MKYKSQRIELRIKVTSQFLGNKMDTARHVMRFDTKYKGKELWWKPDLEQWRWAMVEALDSLSDSNQLMSDVDVDFVSFSTLIKAPTIRRFTRSQTSRNPLRNQEFESFGVGTVLTIPVFLLGCMEKDRLGRAQVRPPTPEELRKCFEIIGQNLGLSPWGNIYGYGRFDVL